MTSDYETQFENLQNIISLLTSKNPNMKSYFEDDKYFNVNNKNGTTFKVKKRKYFYKMARLKKLAEEIKLINHEINTMQRLYVTSKSNAFENELKTLYSKREEKEIAHTSIKNNIKEYPHILFEIISTDGDNQSVPKNVSMKKSLSKSRSAEQKKRKIVKKLLFETYEQCVSQKTSEPTYMTKESIIKHIKEHDPNILRMMPKNINAMKKGEICKILFK